MIALLLAAQLSADLVRGLRGQAKRPARVFEVVLQLLGTLSDRVTDLVTDLRRRAFGELLRSLNESVGSIAADQLASALRGQWCDRRRARAGRQPAHPGLTVPRARARSHRGQPIAEAGHTASRPAA